MYQSSCYSTLDPSCHRSSANPLRPPSRSSAHIRTQYLRSSFPSSLMTDSSPLRTTPKPCLFITGVRPILFAALPNSPLQRVFSLTYWTYSLYLKQSPILHGYNSARLRLPKYTAPQLPMHSIFDPLINPERTTSSHESSIADSQCIYTYYLFCPAYPLDLRCYPD